MIRHEEKRFHPRKQISLPVTYVYSEGPKVDHYRGVTFDLCNSGMSFYTHAPLKQGLALRIQTHIWDSPRTCTVRWRSKKSRNIYKVGVYFR